jgi:HTH-type transcriptional regulator / antitoxin HigA
MSTYHKEISPKIATHPGEMLADEIEARDLSQADFAKLIGMNKSQLNEILKGKRNITADLALLLEKTIGIDADFWLNAQKNFELDSARIENKNMARLLAIEEWNILKEHVAINYFKKQKLISGDPVVDLPIVKSIYNIKQIDELAGINVGYKRYRKTETAKASSINIIGWTKLVYFLSNNENVLPFNASKQTELLNKLKFIFKENIQVKQQVKEVLNAFGIKLIYLPNAEKCPIDGVAMWSNENPIIGMSLRHNRLDNFAFTLFHELGHVFLHLINNPNAEFIDDLDDKTIQKESEEMEANSFASNNLINKNAWDKFFMSPNRLLDEFAIEFSESEKIHPAIVKGRLKYELKSYSMRTKIDNTLS